MFFDHIKTLPELKAEYRRLTLKHHPDVGGDTETMKAINVEYEKAFERVKNAYNAAADEEHQTTETPEEFRAILEALLKLRGLVVELCGSWLWISGNTLENKNALKAAGCHWSASKKMWYWHHAEDGAKWYKGKTTMNEIRTRYGSQTFTGNSETSAYERLTAG